MTPYVALIPVCYLLGSVPFGLLVARFAKGVDVRSYGSGNTGMTNVLRTTGVAPGLAVLGLDLGKGIGAVLLARAVEPSASLEVAAALAALAGHNWSVFLWFKGGKGTATGLGTVLAISPAAALIVAALSLPPLVVSRYVSLGSIMGATSALGSIAALAFLAPTLPLGVSSPTYILYPAIGTPIVLFKHRENIRRILKGQERRIGQKVELSEPVSGTADRA